jgi:hypothetical protein
MMAARLLIVCRMSSTESDERYEVVVKHDMKAVLHMGSFKTLSQARAFLLDHWKKLPGERAMKDIEYGGAIYDKHEGRRRVLTLGVAYLVDEDRAQDRQ